MSRAIVKKGNRCTLFYAPTPPYSKIEAIQVGICGGSRARIALRAPGSSPGPPNDQRDLVVVHLAHLDAQQVARQRHAQANDLAREVLARNRVRPGAETLLEARQLLPRKAAACAAVSIRGRACILASYPTRPRYTCTHPAQVAGSGWTSGPTCVWSIVAPCTSPATTTSSRSPPRTARRSASGPGRVLRRRRSTRAWPRRRCRRAVPRPSTTTRSSEELYLVTQRGAGCCGSRAGARARAGDCAVIPPGRGTSSATPAKEVLRVVCACSPPYSHEDTVLTE